MRKRGSRSVDEEEAFRGAAGLPGHLEIGEGAVETQSWGTSRWAHVLIGMASSSPPVFPELDGPGPSSVVPSCRRMVMSKAGLPVRKDGGEDEQERGGLPHQCRLRR